MKKYIRTGVVVKDCQMSYHDYLDFWYENYCKINLNIYYTGSIQKYYRKIFKTFTWII